MKYILSFIVALSISAASFGQSKPVVTINADGSITVKKDTVIIEKVIVKDTIIYQDRIVIRDSIIYRDRIVVKDSIVYVDKPILVYRDTCMGKDTVIVPPDPGKVAYLSLPTSLKIVAKSGQVIENLQFKNMADIAIRVGNVQDVIIRNCFFNGTGAEAIEIENATNVTIENCLFARMTCGVYAISSQIIKVRNNQFVNTRKRASGHRGQFVQFNGVSGAGNEVINNRGENFPGESDPEDMVSLYASSGTQLSPIKVSGNIFRGGCPSKSGGGIMTGDTGGSWQIVENNKLKNPGNYMFACAGGSNIVIRNNMGYQENAPCINIAMYAYGGQQGASCSNITVQGNSVWIANGNTFYAGNSSESCGPITGANPNFNQTNRGNLTLAQLDFPDVVITMVTPAELLTIRK